MSTTETQSEECTYFRWSKPDTGYQIRHEMNYDGNKDYAVFLSPGELDERAIVPYIEYQHKAKHFIETEVLKDSPVLFARFADLDLSDVTKILEFANQNGFLLPTHIYNFPDRLPLTGEKLALWVNQIWLMKQTFNIWQWSLSKDTDKLASVIKVDEKSIRYQFDTPRSRLWIINKQNHPTLFRKLIPGDFFIPARAFMQMRIDEQLSDMRIKAYKKPPIAMRLVFNSQNELDPYLAPTSLLAAMWLQFRQHVTRERRLKRCEICEQWEDVTINRESWTSHELCVNRDKVKKSRKLMAVKKHLQEGLGVDDISVKLNVGVRDIQRWLKKETENKFEQKP